MHSDSGETRPVRVQATMASHPPPKLVEPLPCPRCQSTNTKFCYYNNYNLAQPRHFCKSCRRYWTQGGTLRNVPVGGGTRRSSGAASKRSRSSSSSSSSTLTATHEPEPVNVLAGSVVVQQGSGPVEPTQMIDNAVISGNGSLASLLSAQRDGTFLALGGSGFGFGYGYGFDEMSLGFGDYLGSPAGAVSATATTAGYDTWQQVEEMEGNGGDCFIWPSLEISMPNNEMK